MRRLLFLSLLCAFAAGRLGRGVGAIEATSLTGYAGSVSGAPGSEVPLPLREVWLRFHEAEFCRGIDAVFIFLKYGMDIWCRVEDEKSYRKFKEMFEPLRASYRTELYATHPERKKKPSEPPPSLLGNEELRAYLQGPYARIGSPDDEIEVSPRDLTRQAGSPWGDGKPGGAPAAAAPVPSTELKERILMFAEQVLDWAKEMERYGDDLPALTFVAMDRTEPPKLRSRAMIICLEHSRKLDRCAANLDRSLTYALPKAAKLSRTPGSDRSVSAGIPPIERAIQVSEAARSAARRVHRFIYPQNPTVGMGDLREPGLLESLKTLRRVTADFQSAITRTLFINSAHE